MSHVENARESLLRAVWNDILSTNASTVASVPAAARAIDAGASPDDVVTAMRAASYETAFGLLFLLTSEHAPEGRPDATDGWALVPFDLTTQTPRYQNAEVFDAVHEDLLTADPTGREGADLWN